MPACPIKYHDDSVVGVSRRHLVKKYLHTLPIDMWQYQRIHFAIGYRNCRIRIGVFLAHHCITNGTDGFRAPTTPCIGDTTEAGLVHKHQSDRGFSPPRFADSGNEVGEFFFQSSCTTILDFGCRLSGASFRQPCR